MSRPQKIMKPIKGSFTQIINAVADGKGVKGRNREQIPLKNERPAEPPKGKEK